MCKNRPFAYLRDTRTASYLLGKPVKLVAPFGFVCAFALTVEPPLDYVARSH